MTRKPKIPNNPMQAYFMGKRHGCQECMDIVSMALIDKCGFHTFEQTKGDNADQHDTHSIEYLFHCAEDTADEISKGRIKRKDIKAMLEEECNLAFSD